MNFLQKIIFCFFICALLAGCAKESNQTENDGVNSSDETIEAESLVELDLLGGPEPQHKIAIPMEISRICGNRQCQSYQAEIVGSKITVNKLTPILTSRNTDKTEDSKETLLTKNSASEINDMVASLGLTAFNTKLIPGEKECAGYLTDQATYRIALNKGDFSQTLDIYTGCKNIPQRFSRLLEWFKVHLENEPSF